MSEFVLLDLMPLIATVLAGVTCGLIGNFLVLRREAMLGDAISHAVLPGLILAFLLLESAGPVAMLLGAAGSGLLCVVLIGVLQRATKLESGASIGVVFTILFAAGVLLVELFARNSHIDAECVLFGNVELLSPWTAEMAVPRQIHMLWISLGLTVVLIMALFKELRLVCFDSAFGSAMGFRPGLLNLLLMAAVAFAVVASFEAVGSILVVAMLVCPAACARLLTDRLLAQLVVSGVIALVTAVAAYFIATRGLAWVSGDPALALPVSGAMATLAGLLVGLCVVAAPRHGLIPRRLAGRRLRRRIMAEDVLGMLYRVEEAGGLPDALESEGLTATHLREALCRTGADRGLLKRAMTDLRAGGEIRETGDRPAEYALTESGRSRASGLIRTHRLWESYLVGVLGLRADHVHRTAEDLEHLTAPDVAAALESRIERQGVSTDTDPHHRPIPRKPAE